SRPVRAAQYVSYLKAHTGLPVWRVLEALIAPHTSEKETGMYRALAGMGVSAVESDKWRPVIASPDIAVAYEKLASGGYICRDKSCDKAFQTSLVPSWVVFYLVGFKVRTPAHAQHKMMDIVDAHLPHASRVLQAPLIVFAALHAARFNLVVLYPLLVDLFIALPQTHPTATFNLFLQALCTTPERGIECARAVVRVLRSMESRGLRLQPDTYERLLKDRFVTLEVTKYLHERMVREGHVPTQSELEAYLRIFAKGGSIHSAEKYYEAIREYSLKNSSAVPLKFWGGSHGGFPHRANTLHLTALNNRISAFGYLQSLLAAQHGATLQSVQSEEDALERRTTVSASHKQVDIADYTTALAAATRDHTIGERALTMIHRSAIRKNPTLRETIVTKTVFIRGLLRRRAFASAAKEFRRLTRSGLQLDGQALAVGLQALTRNGEPHRALALLERHCSSANAALPAKYRTQPPLQLSSIGLNDFLVSLLRTHRPDAVLRLYDLAGPLYRAYPDSRSLSLLLAAARMALRMDNTFTAGLASLFDKNPFRRARRDVPPRTRAEAVAELSAVLGAPTDEEPRVYVSGSWRTESAVHRAQRVFHEVAAGQFAQRGLHDEVDATFLDAHGRSHHPQVGLTDENCFQYVLLVGLAGHAAEEVPRVFTWMRALGVRPRARTLAVAFIFWGE
ncbi:hypothetical protein FISHEDRAFT_21917, partial [Fistulina hepatica ATCC 64428]